MSAFARFALVALAAMCASGAVAAPELDSFEAARSAQRDVIAYHLAQGESRAAVCAVVGEYFDLNCIDTGTEFVLTRGHNTGITYMVTITIPATKYGAPDAIAP